MIESMITTVDNPYDPFEDFDSWNAWDTQHGYHTCQVLARIVINSNDLSDADQDLAIDQAIDDMARENFNGMYRKVTREVSEISEDSGD